MVDLRKPLAFSGFLQTNFGNLRCNLPMRIELFFHVYYYHCKSKETLFNQELKPASNVNVSSEKLMLFIEAVEAVAFYKFKKQKKKKLFY